jgi:excisionase family DNA binding protein
MILLTITEVANYLKISKSTIYKMVMRREIPFIKLRGTLLFEQDELNQWLASYSRKTIEKENAALDILKQRKHG